jgi:alkylation response protein AidB-like acyl-CoA dehydrogenase
MDFAFSEEQQLLRASAREFLTDVFPVERVSQLADSDAGWDPDSWKQLEDLGWLDPELGPLEHAVLFEETGAALYPGPFFSTVALGSTASTVPRTLAWAEPGGPARIADAARTRTSVDNSGRVSGH